MRYVLYMVITLLEADLGDFQGGSTMFQHFGQRLKRDLKQLVDRRLEVSAQTSGSLFRYSRQVFDHLWQAPASRHHFYL